MSNCANCEERDSSNAGPFIGPVTKEGCSGCGTNGDWTGLPPVSWGPGCTPTWDASAQLTAVGRPGGIRLNWSLPADSPECVAFTNVYRAGSSNFNAATLMLSAGGSFFFDTQNVREETEYWYWIQFKSTAGVLSALHGPESSVMMPTIDEIIDQLEGKISNSELNNHLNAEIGNIAVLGVELDQEILDRIDKDNSLNEMFDGLKDDLTTIDASITSLTDKVVNDEKAYIEQIDLVLVQFNASLAAFQTQLVLLATADEALLDYVESFKVSFPDGEGGFNEVGYEEALKILATESIALGVRSTQLEAKVGENSAETGSVQLAQVNGDSALSARIDTLSVTIDGDPTANPPVPSQSAAIEVLAAVVGVDENTVVGDASSSLTATYSIKTQVDGPNGPLISGIGLYNDGNESMFGIHADTFYVASPLGANQSSQDQVFPFIIAPYTNPGTNNTELVIALNAFTMIPDASLGTAMIKNASITDALIGNSITSNDYIAGSQGWGIFKSKPNLHDGYAEFNDIIARGTIYASHIEAGSINVINDPDFMAPGVITNDVLMNIQSDDFVSVIANANKAKGWGIFSDFGGYWNNTTDKWVPGTGNTWAEFNDIYARGNIEASSITAGSIDIVDTLMVQGDAISVASANNFVWQNSTNDDYQKQVSGTSYFSTHKGGKLQLSVTFSMQGSTNDDGQTIGAICEVFFANNNSKGKKQKISFGVSGDQINVTLPISITHTSNTIGSNNLKWAVYLGKVAGYNFPTTLETCSITELVVKR